MRTNTRTSWAGVLGLLFCTAACSCTGDCPDLGGDPEFTDLTVTPSTMAAGDSVDLAIDGDHLGELEESSDGAMEEDEEEESHCPGGHLHVYLDDLQTNPVTMQEAMAFPLTIPEDTEVGDHTLIVRLHNKDHTIYEPEVTIEADITVE